MIIVKEFYKNKSKNKILTFFNNEEVNEYIKRSNSKSIKYYIYESNEHFKADEPDRIVFNIKVKVRDVK